MDSIFCMGFVRKSFVLQKKEEKKLDILNGRGKWNCNGTLGTLDFVEKYNFLLSIFPLSQMMSEVLLKNLQ